MIAMRRGLLVVWLLVPLAWVFLPSLLHLDAFTVTSTAVCVFSLLLNVPQLTYANLRSVLVYDDIQADATARRTFICISTVLMPLYAAALMESVLMEYGALDGFSELPVMLKVAIIRAAIMTLFDVHKLVSRWSIAGAHWYSRCSQRLPVVFTGLNPPILPR